MVVKSVMQQVKLEKNLKHQFLTFAANSPLIYDLDLDNLTHNM